MHWLIILLTFKRFLHILSPIQICWVPKCPFFTTSFILCLSCLIPFCAPNKHYFLTWALNLHRYDYLLFHLINAYDCYNQDFASWIMLTHYDFTKIVQAMREYRCSIPSSPMRIWAFTVSCDFPFSSLHMDPTKGHHFTWAATDMVPTDMDTIDLATTTHHCLKLATIIMASLELVLLFIYWLKQQNLLYSLILFNSSHSCNNACNREAWRLQIFMVAQY